MKTLKDYAGSILYVCTNEDNIYLPLHVAHFVSDCESMEQALAELQEYAVSYGYSIPELMRIHRNVHGVQVRSVTMHLVDRENEQTIVEYKDETGTVI